MKIVLTARRNPSMDRPQFFDYLRNKHWPLVASFPDVLGLLDGYTQNHSMLPDDGADVPTPFRRALDRDSVIEIWVKRPEALDELHRLESYMTHVRPDEARFNDLASLVILLSQETEIVTSANPGRVKRFDFLYPRHEEPADSFNQKLLSTLNALTLDPMHQAIADRQTVHLPIGKLDPGAFVDTGCAAVLATWTSNIDSLSRLGSARYSSLLQSVADPERSFSVVATTFPIKPPSKS